MRITVRAWETGTGEASQFRSLAKKAREHFAPAVPPTMMLYLLVGLGGALGSMARFGLSELFAGPLGETFPWSTLFVNVTGSFLIGFVGTIASESGRPLNLETRKILLSGVLGGYTTFSAFSLQTMQLAHAGEWLRAGGNVASSVVACLVAVWLGHLLAAYCNAQRGA